MMLLLRSMTGLWEIEVEVIFWTKKVFIQLYPVYTSATALSEPLGHNSIPYETVDAVVKCGGGGQGAFPHSHSSHSQLPHRA